MPDQMERYGVIARKNPREIVLLRGLGCVWKRCRFCDYHLDSGENAAENYALNRAALARVTGKYARLEVVNSGSFFELDEDTQRLIEEVCAVRGIKTLHFESHWMYRGLIPMLRERCAKRGIILKAKIGVETFDYGFREKLLEKGLSENSPALIARDFDECCLLFGLTGQTEQSMRDDIATGLSHFERVCVNVMCANTSALAPDATVIETFRQRVMPEYVDNARVDILLQNTDFGVGVQ